MKHISRVDRDGGRSLPVESLLEMRKQVPRWRGAIFQEVVPTRHSPHNVRWNKEMNERTATTVEKHGIKRVPHCG